MSSRVLEAFAGFTFVGAFVAASDAIPRHGTAAVPLPQMQEVGVRYVFHHRRPADISALPLVELPTLTAIGIRVVSAPKSQAEMMWPFIGGPGFIIRIADGGHEGRIYSAHDGSLAGSPEEAAWLSDDYMLEWSK